MKTIHQLHTETGALFKKHLCCPLREALSLSEWLIRDVLELSPLQWMQRGREFCSQDQERQVQSWQNQMIAQQCSLARLRGYKDFWGHRFHMNSDTLEPRWETEGIILLVQEYFSKGKEAVMTLRQTLTELPHDSFPDKGIGPHRILDLGTGTGCLLISLLKEYPKAYGVGIDISLGALEAARVNAHELDIPSSRVQWIHGSWTKKIQGKYDCIISNPPYIPCDAQLDPTVRLWDPSVALYAGKDGLDAYGQLIPPLHTFLETEGVVIMEVGEGQSAAVRGLLEENHFPWTCTVNDLSGRDRYVMAVK